MCEISEKIYAEGLEMGRTEGLEMGRTEGELNAKRTMAYNMHKKGYPDSTIAELLEVSMSRVKGWIDSEMVAVK